MTTRVREVDPRWEDDRHLLDDLAQAVRATDPMTEWIARLGMGAFAWHDIDLELELATLQYDSALDSTVVARQDGVEEYRTMLFEAPSGSVQVEKADDVVNGQLIPAGGDAVWAVSASGTVIQADVDELGIFQFEAFPAEPVRLRWRGGHRTLVTDWFRL